MRIDGGAPQRSEREVGRLRPKSQKIAAQRQISARQLSGMSGIFLRTGRDLRDCTGWLGREDSNLRMAESKSAALPLGYAPSGGLLRRGGARTIATAIRPING